MGCDIHLFVERRESGSWKILPPPFGLARKPFEHDKPVKIDYRVDWERDPKNPAFEKPDESRPLADWFSDRNYNLFAMLANVRNKEFRSTIEEKWLSVGRDPILYPRIEPLDEPRGIPRDASRQYRDEPKEHSETYFTIAELRAYFARKEGKTFLTQGVVTGKVFEELCDGKRPESWSGWISGQNIVTVNEGTYRNLKPYVTHEKAEHGFDAIETHLARERAPDWWLRQFPRIQKEPWKVYVQTEWETGYIEAAGLFLDLLSEIEQFGNPADLRIVCYFDS